MVKSLLPVNYEVVSKLFHGVGLAVSATTSNASIENDNSAPVNAVTGNSKNASVSSLDAPVITVKEKVESDGSVSAIDNVNSQV
jgi:hypothetical protein